MDAIVTLNEALPDQTGKATKFFQTDGTNPSWQYLTQASITVAGVVEIPTASEMQSFAPAGATGAKL